jgi:hypothetical protein
MLLAVIGCLNHGLLSAMSRKRTRHASEPNLRLTKAFRVRIVVPLTFMGSSLAPAIGRGGHTGGRLAKYHSPGWAIKESVFNARVRAPRGKRRRSPSARSRVSGADCSGSAAGQETAPRMTQHHCATQHAWFSIFAVSRERRGRRGQDGEE